MEVVAGSKLFYSRKIKDTKIIWCDLANGFFRYSRWLHTTTNAFESTNLWCTPGAREMQNLPLAPQDLTNNTLTY